MQTALKTSMPSASTFLVSELYIIKCSHFLVCQKLHCFRVRAAHSKEGGGTIIVFRDVLRPLVIAECLHSRVFLMFDFLHQGNIINQSNCFKLCNLNKWPKKFNGTYHNCSFNKKKLYTQCLVRSVMKYQIHPHSNQKTAAESLIH